MIKIKAGKRKAVASALTFCFFLQQSFCLQVLATNISGVTGSNDLSTFVNLVDNQINIQGIVNAVGKNGAFNNGHAVFISPNGMVVGSSGVLNVGSLTVLTPDSNSYEKYKSDLKRPSLIADYKSKCKNRW